MWLRLLRSVVFTFGLIASVAHAATSSGHFANSAGARDYKIFVPDAIPPRAPLLVVLHGCFMTGDDMASGTRLNDLATANGFAVLYPEQTYSDNVWKCWNWFKPENQRRGSGESFILSGLTQKMIADYSLDASRVYVVGLSAGAAMASDLLACYSDIYAGGVIASGLEYEAARDEDEAQTAMSQGSARSPLTTASDALACSPPRNALLDVLIVHGSADGFVNEQNGEQAYAQFVAINTSIFKARGGDVSTIAEATSSIAGRDPAQMTTTSFGGWGQVTKVIVKGMDHGWSGGADTAPYMQPDGVDASKMLVEMFLK